MTFVCTGVLPAFERDHIVQKIQDCGGRVTHTVSKKTSYVLVGDGAGENKMDKVGISYSYPFIFRNYKFSTVG